MKDEIKKRRGERKSMGGRGRIGEIQIDKYNISGNYRFI